MPPERQPPGQLPAYIQRMDIGIKSRTEAVEELEAVCEGLRMVLEQGTSAHMLRALKRYDGKLNDARDRLETHKQKQAAYIEEFEQTTGRNWVDEANSAEPRKRPNHSGFKLSAGFSFLQAVILVKDCPRCAGAMVTSWHSRAILVCVNCGRRRMIAESITIAAVGVGWLLAGLIGLVIQNLQFL